MHITTTDIGSEQASIDGILENINPKKATLH